MVSSQHWRSLLSFELFIRVAIFLCRLTPWQQGPGTLPTLAALFLPPSIIPTVGPHHFSFLPSFLLGEMRLERCILMEAKACSCPIYLNPLWYFSFSIFQLISSVLLPIFRLLPSGHIQYIRQPGYHSVSDQSTSDPSKMSRSMFPFTLMRHIICLLNVKRSTCIKYHNYNALNKIRSWGIFSLSEKEENVSTHTAGRRKASGVCQCHLPLDYPSVSRKLTSMQELAVSGNGFWTLPFLFIIALFSPRD